MVRSDDIDRTLHFHGDERGQPDYNSRRLRAADPDCRRRAMVHATAEQFLLAFHARDPGVTARAFGRGRVEDGRSSYQVLADVARPGQRVLDLGCGDGFLLEELVVRGHVPSALVGVDLSPDELAAARCRIALADVALVCEAAQELSAADGQLDCVLSHLAFMLMSDIERVMAELSRVLCSGGTFATIVGGGPGPGDAFELFLDLLNAASADLIERAPRLGDRRARDAIGLAPLLRAARFESIEETALTVRLDGTAAQVWETLTSAYEMSFVPAWRREELRARFSSEAAQLADRTGFVPCSMRVRCIRARRV